MNSALEVVQNRILSPWVDQPYRLLSWWNMERFSATAFSQIAGLLAEFPFTPNEAPPGYVFSADTCSAFVVVFDAIRKHCEEIGLRVSLACIDDIVSELRDGVTVEYVGEVCRRLDATIRYEMEAYQFFYIPGDRAEFYSQKLLFGEAAISRFPAIQFDMVEAGNCCAMGRATACVFHLMRIMEMGVQEFGAALKVKLATEKNWQNILDEVNKAIKTLPPKEARTVDLSQASANLYSVKLAWRNQVMHPNDVYTVDEAKDILLLVKIFMRHLSTII